MNEVDRETLETDVLIVGAGPAGLSCALRLAQLIRQQNEKEHTGVSEPGALRPENIYVLEKADEVGAHCLSGAVLDPRALAELIPDFQAQGAPLQSPVRSDAVYFLTSNRRWKLPVNPPFLRNHGNYIVSLNQLVKWLGSQVEQAGVNIFTGFSGMEVLYDGDRVVGVRTDDKGISRGGTHKSNFQPGYNLKAKITVFAEGPRGSLTKQLVAAKNLHNGRDPQAYSLGVKELWDVPQGRVHAGQVMHTLGWPLTRRQFGGGFVYASSNTRLSLGLVAGLDYEDPRFDVHNAFQLLKTHPWIRCLLDGGQMVRYGAKTIPEGGYFAVPKTMTDGALIVGDAAGFLNSQRLKGIHLAMKSGMLAAETILESLVAGDYSQRALAEYEHRWRASWLKQELWKARNFHQAFEGGLWAGALHAALQLVTNGRGLYARYPSRPGHERMRPLKDFEDTAYLRAKSDGKLTFDKVSDVYHSATRHEEDQPPHLLIADLDVCQSRCTREYGNPCQYFCPAAVYEIEDAPGPGKRPKLNPSNCVHCKTCDIADPYGIITWVCPEGGGGPHYDGM